MVTENLKGTEIPTALRYYPINPTAKDMIFRDFYNYLYLLEAEVELHASMYEWPVGLNDEFMTEPVSGKKTQKYRVELNIWVTKTHQGLYLNPVGETDGPITGTYYQDEWSNIEGEAPMPPDPCKCPICQLKTKRQELWDDMDYALASAAMEFMKERTDQINLRRKSYSAIIEKGIAKSMEKIMNLVKALRSEGKTKEEIKEIITKAFQVHEKGLEDFCFGKGFTIGEERTDTDVVVEEFCKSTRVTTDVVDFSKSLYDELPVEVRTALRKVSEEKK